MRVNLSIGFFLLLLLTACTNEKASQPSEGQTPVAENVGEVLIQQLVEKVGDYQALLQLKDVVYTYTYTTSDGRSDISTEKYVFDGELSYGAYEQHERTLAQLEGKIEQGYDGEGFWLKHNGKLVSDSTYLTSVAFTRPTNFYWFAMLPKLLDPGLTYEYLGEQAHDSTIYEVVKVGFEYPKDKPKDFYQLYINQESGLVDQFLFTVAEYDMMDTPLLMKVEYVEVEGLLIPAKRKYKLSNWEAEVTDKPWTLVSWTDIQFDNGLTGADFSKSGS